MLHQLAAYYKVLGAKKRFEQTQKNKFIIENAKVINMEVPGRTGLSCCLGRTTTGPVMEFPADATRAMVAFLSHWLAEEEVRSWLRACAKYADHGPGTGVPPEPWEVVRTALEELLEAKTLVDLYHENDQEGPDPFTADLTALLRVLPPSRPGTGEEAWEPRLLLQIHTKEILERCQRAPRRPSGNPESLLEPLLGAADGIPQRRSL
jgi:hypothetical protein